MQLVGRLDVVGQHVLVANAVVLLVQLKNHQRVEEGKHQLVQLH